MRAFSISSSSEIKLDDDEAPALSCVDMMAAGCTMSSFLDDLSAPLDEVALLSCSAREQEKQAHTQDRGGKMILEYRMTTGKQVAAWP
jgi:hypothetical protein